VHATALPGDGDVEAVLGELLGQLQADAAGAPGYHRELVLPVLHASSFHLVVRGFLPPGACTLAPLVLDVSVRANFGEAPKAELSRTP
jgi:hypothetical protein